MLVHSVCIPKTEYNFLPFNTGGGKSHDIYKPHAGSYKFRHLMRTKLYVAVFQRNKTFLNFCCP